MPSLWHATSSATSEPSLEVLGSHQSPGSRYFDVELRPLSSTGVTRLQRYYGPLRHPRRPGLALAGCRLMGYHHRRGFPCCLGSPSKHAVAITPTGPLGARFALLPQRRRPSPQSGRVGSRITFFEACSAFTHVTACLVAKSPCDPLHRRLWASSLPYFPLRLLPTGATLVGWDLHPLEIRAFARRTT